MYLIQSNRVVLAEAYASMAIFSSAYLASLPFKADPSTAVRENALNGYYGLLDYFVSSWQDHLYLSLEHSRELSPSTFHHLHQAVIALLQRLNHDQISEDFGDDLECLKSYFKAHRLKHFMKHLERISAGIRKVVEGIDSTVLNGQSRDVFFSLNGKQRYKCSKLRCLRFSEGFECKEERDRHINQHCAPFTCSIESCPRGKVGFIVRADLDQHTKQAHTRPTNKPRDLFPTRSGPVDSLYDACARGDMQGMRKLTTSAMSVRIDAKHVAVAANNNQVGLCRYIAQNAEDICKNFMGTAPTIRSLYIAMDSNDTDMFRVLVEAATPEQKDKYFDDNTAIYLASLAVNYAKREIFDTLLSIRSDMQAPLSYTKILMKAVGCEDLSQNYQIFGRHQLFEGQLVDKQQGYQMFEYVMSLIPPEDLPTILSTPTMNQAMAFDCTYGILYLLRQMDENTLKVKSEARASPLYRASKVLG